MNSVSSASNDAIEEENPANQEALAHAVTYPGDPGGGNYFQPIMSQQNTLPTLNFSHLRF